MTQILTDIGQNSTSEALSRTQFAKRKDRPAIVCSLSSETYKNADNLAQKQATKFARPKKETVKTEYSRLLNLWQANK